jgi:hypothetical protein
LNRRDAEGAEPEGEKVKNLNRRGAEGAENKIESRENNSSTVV